MISGVAFAVMMMASSVGAALVALVIVTLASGSGKRSPGIAGDQSLERTVFLFDDLDVIDTTRSAQAILEGSTLQGSDRDRMMAFLAPKFPGLEEGIQGLVDHGRLSLTGKDGLLRIEAEHLGSAIRIELVDPTAEGHGVLVDAITRRADEEELARLREVVSLSPALTWRLDDEGEITWANRAYIDRAAAHLGSRPESLTWPLPVLLTAEEGAFSGEPRRLRLASAGGDQPQWYECRSFASGTGSLHFAVPVEAAVKAETTLRDFVQTLTKTFAHLPIGLAIFDRQRRLALFNPALIDLTSLGPDFLSSRPTLFAFLDRMREARMIPEPKDYPTWRTQMMELEKAAASGFYQETWTLMTGQTYRVVGRPHPDGAVAFLFEDISAEMSLTRRFRSELELGQTVIDSLEEAIAVFAPAGNLVLSNARYAELWGMDPGLTLASVNVRDAVALWQTQTCPTDLWPDAADFLTDLGERADWCDDAQMRDGRTVHCQFRRMTGGATLVTFRVAGSDATRISRLRRRPRHAGVEHSSSPAAAR